MDIKETARRMYDPDRSLQSFLEDCAARRYYDNGPLKEFPSCDLTNDEVLYLVEWWKKHHTEKTYTIRVLPTNHGYLNIEQNNGGIGLASPNQILDFKTHFTKQEIEQLKQRDDLAIDWDKAKIEPVEDDK